MGYLVGVTVLWAFSFSLIGVYLAGQVDTDQREREGPQHGNADEIAQGQLQNKKRLTAIIRLPQALPSPADGLSCRQFQRVRRVTRRRA